MAPIVRLAGGGEADHGGHGGGGDEKAGESGHVSVLFRLPGSAPSPPSVPKVWIGGCTMLAEPKLSAAFINRSAKTAAPPARPLGLIWGRSMVPPTSAISKAKTQPRSLSRLTFTAGT